MHPTITLTDTDRDLPEHIKNGFMRYRDFKPLTQGGEAMLQTCLDENLGRVVVMKTLLPQLQNLEVYRKRFLREARVTALIPHPATVPVYEISRDREGNTYFTMKRLGGRDLCDILDKIAERDEATVKAFPLDDLLNIMIHVGQCLSYAHAIGVVHRDVKPANIMVGDYGEVTLLDWGLAKVWDMEETDDLERFVRSGQQQQVSGRLTGRGDVQGTPFYMSPEQVRETGDVDARTDVYNMGIILFEILTNQSFMSGKNFNEIKRKILEDPVRSPGDTIGRSKVPPELDAICLKALLKDPKDRYATMEAFVDDIRAYLLGKPVSVYKSPPLARLLNSSSRRTFNISSFLWMTFGALGILILQLLWKLLVR
ncbi:MAG: serine/threonine protein kinase [Planctomycetaceae bacterium]|nr:serine/threonine protein kinase [Planctomycetaceae bacterium]